MSCQGCPASLQAALHRQMGSQMADRPMQQMVPLTCLEAYPLVVGCSSYFIHETLGEKPRLQTLKHPFLPFHHSAGLTLLEILCLPAYTEYLCILEMMRCLGQQTSHFRELSTEQCTRQGNCLWLTILCCLIYACTEA